MQMGWKGSFIKEENMSRWKGMRNFKIVLAVSLVFLLGMTIGLSRSYKVSARSDNIYEDLKIFTDVLGLLQKEYVEETNSKDLVYGAIKGMLETLDPHSAFMPPNMYKEMQEETKGRFEGLGIEITFKDGVLTVVSPIEDTPAFRVGILAGDQILKIDGESTKDLGIWSSSTMEITPLRSLPIVLRCLRRRETRSFKGRRLLG